jgi:hypothetical protein
MPFISTFMSGAGVFDATRIALPAATERRLVPRPEPAAERGALCRQPVVQGRRCVLERAADAREHFVHFAAHRRATWTLVPYSEHFVHFTNHAIAKWTKCTLTAADLPTLPTQL